MHSPGAQHYYESLARYSLQKATNFFTYIKFGNEILDFSLNTPNKIKDFREIDEIKALKNLYGDTIINQRIKKIQDTCAISKLRRLEIGEGCCLGMSYDFISSYLMNVKLGKPPLEAVVSRYKDGAPDKAVLEHIFYSATHGPIPYEEQKNFVDKYFSKIEEDFERKKESLAKMTVEEQYAALAQIKLDFNIQLNKIKELPLKYYLKNEEDVISSYELTINMNESAVYKFKKREEELSFENFTKNLIAGVYKIGILLEGHKGHAMVYIKTKEGQHIIYDPNLGILAVAPSVSATKLYEIVKSYTKEENFSLFKFEVHRRIKKRIGRR
ncbi:hypothetical protein RHABOEDO_000494 [Candidatus Rhabdochlamydia oedothoracis]|uniref:Peptidase C58 YopT-type domain-containing protein n=1 Tax=Candidatus Rhabdochlamydia oedothoracis TaxID=2720720 RepID=A0ABX8V5N8_9BACT|nr:hypothetical protein [Candidatus Rhabdochlamydia oedothoracis]QYF48353.1 hypothetical protein RHABOEDO_000494 [Candidatus Rhabdochlamydia oedothoracis]